MDRAEIESIFFQHVTDDFCRSLLKSLFTARQLAYEACRNEFPPPEAENIRSSYARAKLEVLIRDAAEIVDGAKAEVRRAPKSRWNYTELRVGAVLLTASSVDTPCAPVHKAEFRKGLAEGSQQSLLGDDDPGEYLYSLLLHTPYHFTTRDEGRQFGYLPGSAYFAFPAADLTGYVHEVDLFERYPDIVQGYHPQEWDEAAIVRYKYNSRRTSWSTAS